MKTAKEYAEIVNQAIDGIEYPAGLPGLYEPIKYALAAGGKRLRPVLLLAANEAFGGEQDNALWPAVGIEMFHNFTLVHDDVMDNADMRRGRPTVYKKWNTNTAILSGDAMTSLAYKCMAGCPPMYLAEVIDRFGLMTMAVYEGQQIDTDFETADRVTFKEYINMVVGKTSALIAYPLAIGALIAGADQDDIQAMFDFGIALGIAFQMQDDWLDVYGDSATFGKAIGGDILNAKKTWLYIIAQDTDPDFPALANADIPADEKIAKVTAAYNRLGIKERGQALIARYTDDAIDSLNSTTLPAEAKAWFADFANKLIHRDK